MENLPKNINVAPRAETWVPRMEKPISIEFYDLQLAFAKAVAEHRGMELKEAIRWYAPFLREHALSSDYTEIKEGVSLENIATHAYLEDTKRPLELVEYHPAGGTRFGCSSYTYDEKEHAGKLHFVNAEYDKTGPLSLEKLPQRRQEMRDVIIDLKKSHPDVKAVRGYSWLYNLDAYKRLYPKSFTEALVPAVNRADWGRGTTIWGQFIDSDGNLKHEEASILLKRMSPEHTLEKPEDLLAFPLLKPLRAEAPVEDFYKEYGIT